MNETDYIKLDSTTELGIIKQQLNKNTKDINCIIFILFLILFIFIIITFIMLNILYNIIF
jgi:hypothetical protein